MFPFASLSFAQAGIGASITVSRGSVTPGETVKLTWASQQATSVSINGRTVASSGSSSFRPSASVVLKLTANGPGGTATAQTLVTIATSATPPPAPTPAPTPAPAPAPAPGPTPPSNTAGAPHINYTDLNVGSGTGGNNGNGVYVRIFGSHFGPTQNNSQVLLGGNLVTNCSLCTWSDTAIVAQLGSKASTGKIVVSVNNVSSNGTPFTVTPTTIVFVSPNGSDNNNGSFASPFKTWRAAFNSITSSDNNSPAENAVIYLEPGVAVSTDDGRGYRASVSTDIGGSSPVKQIAIVGFPGGTASIGSTGVENGVHGWGKYFTIADLTIIGKSSAIDAEAGNIRIVNNDISCPSPENGLGGTACVLGETDDPSETWVFQGNNVHDTGGNVDKTYHAVYFSTGVNHADVGWNSIGQNFKGYCRSIMFHATTGGNLSDLHVHDNTITGGYCDAIGFASVDPSLGTVEAYNNVISHVALASNPYGVANEVGIAINSDPASSTSGTVQVYNNTVVDAGAYTIGHQNGCFGVVTAGAALSLVNNICSQPSATQPYIEPGSQNVSGSHNLWYGAGSPPAWDSSPVTQSPAFSSPGSFSLQSSSAAKHEGITFGKSTRDIVGTDRSVPPSIGAFE